VYASSKQATNVRPSTVLERTFFDETFEREGHRVRVDTHENILTSRMHDPTLRSQRNPLETRKQLGGNRMLRTATLSLALTLGLTTSVFAQDPMGEPAPAPMDPAVGGTEMSAAGGDASTYLGRSVLSSAGQFRADVFLIANLSKNNAFKPFSLSPDLYYGLSDQLQIGIVHTTPLRWQQPGGAGTSLCLSGEDNNCTKVYDNVGLDVQFGLLQGGLTDLAVQGTLYLNSFDPATLALGLGLNGKHRFTEMLGLAFNPQVLIGLNERDAGNKERLFIPVELQLQIIPPVAFMLQAALHSPFEDFGDFYQIPVGIAAMLNVNPMIDVGLRFAFDNLLGKQFPGAKRGDARTLSAVVGLRF
jgi:hypothetical protein